MPLTLYFRNNANCHVKGVNLLIYPLTILFSTFTSRIKTQHTHQNNQVLQPSSIKTTHQVHAFFSIPQTPFHECLSFQHPITKISNDIKIPQHLF
jgi:hypothetical protein